MEWEDHRREFIANIYDSKTGVLNSLESLTPIEKIAGIQLAYLILDTGVLVTRLFIQAPIGKYTADFCILYKLPGSKRTPLKLVIECDGHDFHEKTKQQASKDKKRDRYFQTNGYIVLRYSGSDIVSRPFSIQEDLMRLINS